MSHPQPTPQDDEQTPVKPWAIPFDELTEGQVITVEVKGSAKRYRVKSVTHEGNTWTASVVPAELDELQAVYWPISQYSKVEPVFDVTALAEASAAAVQRRIMEGEVITFSRTDHHTPEGWSHVAGGPYTPTATDNQVINPTLIESIAQWLGERESTHLWPEIHESDKACYRDAARDLVATLEAAGHAILSADERAWFGALRAGQSNAVAAVVLPEPDEHGEWGNHAKRGWAVSVKKGAVVLTLGSATYSYQTRALPPEAGNLAAALLAAKVKIEAGE